MPDMTDIPALADLGSLLAGMEPKLHAGTYVFVTLPAGLRVEPDDVVASIREPEGMSVIMAEASALECGLVPVFRCAWITLTVHSDLEAVGLTAAFAAALGQAGISCNVVAGTRHDHIFVPVGRAGDALLALQQLQSSHSVP